MMALSSTAEVLAPPDPIPFLSVSRRRQDLIWYLRSTIDTDTAEALASPGYRALPRCGGCSTCREGYGCNRDPEEQVQGSRGGKRVSADPRFVRAVVARLGQFDAVLVKRAPSAVAALPADERLVVLLELGMGLSQQEVARQLKVSRSTVLRTRERALDHLVEAVWG